jgi:homoserine kinase type II
MATFTQLDDDSIGALAAAFGVGAVSSWGVIAAGTINSNFWLEAGGARWFLRINEGKAEADVRYEAELVAALAAAGVPTPVPHRAGDRPFALHDGKHASLFPWVAGVHRCQAGVAPADASAVGAALATLHLAGAPLAAEFPRDGIYTAAHIVDRFESFRDSSDAAVAAAVPILDAELAWLTERAATRDAAARGIIHADLFRDNVLFDDAGSVAALIDFEQACVGSLAYDLAVLLNAWCFGDDFDPALSRAMVDGYRAVRPLPPADREALYIECRGAAARFAVTRITDVHLQTTSSTKDFRRYLARLARWQSASRAGFARDLGLDLV